MEDEDIQLFDEKEFEKQWRKTLEANTNIDFWQDTVDKLITKNKTISGVITKMGTKT